MPRPGMVPSRTCRAAGTAARRSLHRDRTALGKGSGASRAGDDRRRTRDPRDDRARPGRAGRIRQEAGRGVRLVGGRRGLDTRGEIPRAEAHVAGLEGDHLDPFAVRLRAHAGRPSRRGAPVHHGGRQRREARPRRSQGGLRRGPGLRRAGRRGSSRSPTSRSWTARRGRADRRDLRPVSPVRRRGVAAALPDGQERHARHGCRAGLGQGTRQAGGAVRRDGGLETRLDHLADRRRGRPGRRHRADGDRDAQPGPARAQPAQGLGPVQRADPRLRRARADGEEPRRRAARSSGRWSTRTPIATGWRSPNC